MRLIRHAGERGVTRTGWLDSRHAFSFGAFHDPAWMGWGPLRVLNDDRVAPGAGFPTHRHANMEILTGVLDGALAHRDDAGGEGVVRAGEWQWMGAGHGIAHSEFNASSEAPVRFVQVWIQPDRVNLPPGHALRAGDAPARDARWRLVASPDGADSSLAIRQQAWLRLARLSAGDVIDADLDPARRYWLQPVAGAVAVDGDAPQDSQALRDGDALAIAGEGGRLRITATADADLLLFDLPD